ncbi:MAG TPA: ABC transporter permease [Candidatus Sulfotelmatobacter sp.]
MNTHSTSVPESFGDSHLNAPAAMAPTRPMYWSVRRELWENRSIYIAPLAVACVYLAGYLISLCALPRSMRAIASAHSMPEPIALAMPFSHAAMLLMLIGVLVGVFYSLDALHGERRDRSILFWKSLPVSDLTTVLSKASIPLAVLPVLVFAITVALQIVMRLVNLAVVLVTGSGAAELWPWLPFFQMTLVLLYSLAVTTLWFAPIYCWMLLVSGWARRVTFLWVVLPPLAIAGVEKIAFRTSYFGLLMEDRLIGFAARAFDLKDKNGVAIDAHFIPLTQLAPGRFLTSASLWGGLLVAAGLLAAAVRLRHYREPI